MKKCTTCLLGITVLVILAIFISCNPNIETTYPSWFDEYSGESLTALKSAQDAFDCFGNTIGPNVIILGSNESPPAPDITYDEDATGKFFMASFATRDSNPLVDSTDIQPFKDAVLASGFIHDASSSTPNDNHYVKGDVEIQIYEIDTFHFEFVVEEIY